MFLFSRENVNCCASYIKTFHLCPKIETEVVDLLILFIFWGGWGEEVQTKGFFGWDSNENKIVRELGF